MRRALRGVGLVLVALLPGFLKRPAYRLAFGYEIGRGVRLGVAYLDCAHLAIADDVSIGHFVAFVRCGAVSIGSHVVIGPLNLFRGGTRIELGDYCQILRFNVVNAIPDNDCVGEPEPAFVLGYGAVMTAEHRVDFTDRVSIGRCTVLAGRNSSIWTHQRRTTRPVHVGDYCYVGSEARLAPGSFIGDCSIVALGSVVMGPLRKRFMLYAGNPASAIRALRESDSATVFARTRPDLPEEAYPSWRHSAASECGVEDRA